MADGVFGGCSMTDSIECGSNDDAYVDVTNDWWLVERGREDGGVILRVIRFITVDLRVERSSGLEERIVGDVN